MCMLTIMRTLALRRFSVLIAIHERQAKIAYESAVSRFLMSVKPLINSIEFIVQSQTSLSGKINSHKLTDTR
jgi:hypothetical protein